MNRIILLLISFTFFCSAFGQAPVISSFSPASGTIGTVITISGNNFNTVAANNAVLFGGIKAQVVNATATQLTVKVPAGAIFNPISVVNTDNRLTGYSSASFAVTNTTPVNSNLDIDFEPEAYVKSNGYSSYSEPRSALADIDGDGKTDILIVGDYSYDLT
ncbi:MAG: hypothetical protein EOP47_23770, partial [Sphingobacteriaceae bacterium]